MRTASGSREVIRRELLSPVWV